MTSLWTHGRLNQADWFTEISAEKGFIYGFQITGRLHEEQTPYQRIEVYQTKHFGHLLVLDGVVMLTEYYHYFYHEMMTHPVLYAHPAPADVVIVGGGDCGILREVARHDEVRSITQVELDERVMRVSEKFFSELCEANTDTRSRLVFTDAIDWMKQAPAGSADVLILDTVDPVGQAERLFSEEFYRECHRVLKDGGMMVAQTGSPILDMDFLVKVQQRMRQASFTGVQTLQFPAPCYPISWWTASLAYKGQSLSTPRPLMFETRYYNEATYRACQMLPEFLNRLSPGKG